MKKKMKQILGLFIVLTMASCGNSKSGGEKKESSAKAEKANNSEKLVSKNSSANQLVPNATDAKKKSIGGCSGICVGCTVCG
jgi:protein involved in sex pheromone biosynthesis